jgi:hypothetical protein
MRDDDESAARDLILPRLIRLHLVAAGGAGERARR